MKVPWVPKSTTKEYQKLLKEPGVAIEHIPEVQKAAEVKWDKDIFLDWF
jgi:hypothetical protein